MCGATPPLPEVGSPHMSSSEPSTQSGKESHCCLMRTHWPLAHRNWLGRQTAVRRQSKVRKAAGSVAPPALHPQGLATNSQQTDPFQGQDQTGHGKPNLTTPCCNTKFCAVPVWGPIGRPQRPTWPQDALVRHYPGSGLHRAKMTALAPRSSQAPGEVVPGVPDMSPDRALPS